MKSRQPLLLARRQALGAVIAAAIVLTAAGCGNAATGPLTSPGLTAVPGTGSGSSSAQAETPPTTSGPGSSSGSPAGTRGATAGSGATVLPTLPPSAVPDTTPGPTSTPPVGASPTGANGPAAQCSGTSANRDFFAAVAQGVPWQVYCAVLPDGWYVETGNYRLGGGGRLSVSYKGPGGAHLTLQEGAFCTAGASACSPRDRELGQTRFGNRTGTLVTLGPDEPGDGYAVYVSPGAAQSWSASATNIEQAEFQAIAAALAPVGQ